MKLRITDLKEFVQILKKAHGLTDVKFDFDKFILLREKHVVSACTDLGISCMWSTKYCVERADEDEATDVFLTDKLCKFLSGVDPDAQVILDITNCIKVIVDGKQELKLNIAEHSTAAFDMFIRERQKVAILPEDFGKKVRTALTFISDFTRPNIAGVHLSFKDNQVVIDGTDGRGLFQSTFPSELSKEVDVTINGVAIKKYIDFINGQCIFSVFNDSVVFFETETLIIRQTVNVSDYPDVSKFISKDQMRSAKFSVKQLQQCVAQAAIVGNDYVIKTYLTFNDNLCSISVSSPDIGDTTLEMECKYSKVPITMAFMNKILSRALQACDSDTVEAYFNEQRPLTIFDGNNVILAVPMGEPRC